MIQLKRDQLIQVTDVLKMETSHQRKRRRKKIKILMTKMIQKLQKKKNQKMNRNNLRPQRTINHVSNAISQDILQRTVQVRSPVITVVKLVILQKIVQIIQTWKQISYATTVMKLVTVKETVLKIAEAPKRILIWNATIVKKPATYQGIVQKMVV